MMDRTWAQNEPAKSTSTREGSDRAGSDHRSSGCGAGSGAARLAGQRGRGGLRWHRRLRSSLRSIGDHLPTHTAKGPCKEISCRRENPCRSKTNCNLRVKITLRRIDIVSYNRGAVIFSPFFVWPDHYST